MDLTDPSTGNPLPADAIQRVMHICQKVHIYQIPPMSSLAGHKANDWTDDPKRHIFTARLRLVETDAGGSGDNNAHLTTCIVLEDPASGQLFAAAPYDSPAAVEPVIDSSRFFAIRVRDPSGGRKALLGIGFEERSDAFDFAVSLEEARRVLGMNKNSSQPVDTAQQKPSPLETDDLRRDLSLKEGETITVNIGGKFGTRRREKSVSNDQKSFEGASLNSFALAPPPSAAGGEGGSPKAQEVRAQKRLSRGLDKENAKALGFDDGQFGEFA